MVDQSVGLSSKNLSATGVALTVLLAALPLSAEAATLVSERASLGGNDQIDWSSLGPVQPFNFLPNSFSATSTRGLGLNVNIPPVSGLTSPFVFQTSPAPGIPTNFANGDFILFTGFIPGPPPAVGNPGPLTITFDTPVFSAGAQIAVDDDTAGFTASISAFDNTNTLLGTFDATGSSSLALDNSAIFLGVESATPNISKLVFDTSVVNRAFGINTLSIKAVPEPSSILGSFFLGVLGTGTILKRKRSS